MTRWVWYVGCVLGGVIAGYSLAALMLAAKRGDNDTR